MATCADFQKELDEQRNDFSGYLNRANQSISRGSGTLPTDIGSLSSIANALNTDAGQTDIIVSYLTQFIEQANRAGCSAQANQAKSILQQFQNIQQRIGPLATKVNNAFREAQRATTQSTESTDNSGTGNPGTAGQGPGANIPAQDGRAGAQLPPGTTVDDPNLDLPTVTVTGNKISKQPLQIGDPNFIDPGVPDVTAPNFAFGDDIDEVTVQGNKINKGNLQVDEPGMIGAGTIDVDAPNINLGDEELEEFTITAKRPNSTTGATSETRKQATTREQTNFKARKDWRVRLALAPTATYLYADESNPLLAPLRSTDGVLFPYTPSVQVNYNANYTPTEVTHSNYKFYQYQNSSVDYIIISCDFTAQDTAEARYLLAVIHFFRSATKMFYGQDQNPKAGTPPPLCYLYGFGELQFNAHPLAITNFSYNLPTDVDYIRAGGSFETDGLEEVTVTGKRYTEAPPKPSIRTGLGTLAQSFIQNRLASGIAGLGNAIGLKLSVGGGLGAPDWVQSGFKPDSFVNEQNVTYVPTKISLQIQCVPIISRYEISNQFSFKDYANGSLLRGVNRKGAGFW